MDEVWKKGLMITQNKNCLEVEDILSNILSRLPVKCLLRCKSVCKHWGVLISSPNFIRLHLSKSRENPTFIAHPCFESKWNTHLMKFDEDIFEKIPLPDCKGRFKGIVCSFNGLICWFRCLSFFDASADIYIFNPSTRKGLLLPRVLHQRQLYSIGVSFGPQINEYNVYGFFRKFDYVKNVECDVYKYSSGAKAWSVIGTIGGYPVGSRHILINGIVYWFMLSEINGFVTDSVLAIDREDNFSRISLPRESLSMEMVVFFVEFEGRLSFISSHAYINSFDLWVLEDGNQSVWLKKWSDITIPLPKSECSFFVAARKNEILLITRGQKQRCLVYGVDNKTWREVNWLDEVPRSYPTAFAFTESLVPCGEELIDG